MEGSNPNSIHAVIAVFYLVVPIYILTLYLPSHMVTSLENHVDLDAVVSCLYPVNSGVLQENYAHGYARVFFLLSFGWGARSTSSWWGGCWFGFSKWRCLNICDKSLRKEKGEKGKKVFQKFQMIDINYFYPGWRDKIALPGCNPDFKDKMEFLQTANKVQMLKVFTIDIRDDLMMII